MTLRPGSDSPDRDGPLFGKIRAASNAKELPMRLPTISLVDLSDVGTTASSAAVRAVNRQIVEDFMPIWGHGWLLRLDEPAFEPTGDVADLEDADPEPVRADGVIYLVNEGTVQGALGYHSINSVELPVGFVFTDLIDEWSVTLSHEALEMIADPTINIFAPGPSPDPAEGGAIVLHTYEVCDAVERFAYGIDDVLVSDFVTPWYFSQPEGLGTRNDFLGVEVTSFGIMPGCHIQYFDLNAATFKTFTARGDASDDRRAMRNRATSQELAELAVGARRPTDEALASTLEDYNSKCSDTTRVNVLPEGFQLSRSARRFHTPM